LGLLGIPGPQGLAARLAGPGLVLQARGAVWSCEFGTLGCTEVSTPNSASQKDSPCLHGDMVVFRVALIASAHSPKMSSRILFVLALPANHVHISAKRGCEAPSAANSAHVSRTSWSLSRAQKVQMGN